MSPLDLPVANQVALFVFASYFSIIFGLFYLIVSSIKIHADAQTHAKRAWIFIGLSVTSLTHTWYWMFRFMSWSFKNFESSLASLPESILLRISTWLSNTGLFEQAWMTACSTSLSWWWSEQLCIFTAGAFTIFLFLNRERVPYAWAYMVLGQLVAISVAWSLFNLALIVTPSRSSERTKTTHLPASLTIPVVLSFFTISISPYTSSSTFLPNLLAMHLLLIFPLLLPEMRLAFLSPRATSFYTFVALLSGILRVRTTLKVLSTLHITSPFFSYKYPVDTLYALWSAPGMLYEEVWRILQSHPAQASIGWDLIWTSIAWLTWGVYGYRMKEETRWTWRKGIRNIFSTLTASIGVMAPMEFGKALRDGGAKEE